MKLISLIFIAIILTACSPNPGPQCTEVEATVTEKYKVVDSETNETKRFVEYEYTYENELYTDRITVDLTDYLIKYRINKEFIVCEVIDND